MHRGPRTHDLASGQTPATPPRSPGRLRPHRGGWATVPGFGRRAEKACRSESASAPGLVSSPLHRSHLRVGSVGALEGQSSEGSHRCSYRPQQPVLRRGRRGLRPVAACRSWHGPGWSGSRVDLGGEQSPWKDRVSTCRQRRSDTTDSSTEQGREVGRSRRLEGSARATSVVRACREWFGGFGRWTAHERVLSGTPREVILLAPGRHAASSGTRPLARSRRFGAVGGGGPRMRCAGSPVPACPGDVGVRRSRRIGASPYSR